MTSVSWLELDELCSYFGLLTDSLFSCMSAMLTSAGSDGSLLTLIIDSVCTISAAAVFLFFTSSCFFIYVSLTPLNFFGWTRFVSRCWILRDICLFIFAMSPSLRIAFSTLLFIGSVISFVRFRFALGDELCFNIGDLAIFFAKEVYILSIRLGMAYSFSLSWEESLPTVGDSRLLCSKALRLPWSETYSAMSGLSLRRFLVEPLPAFFELFDFGERIWPWVFLFVLTTLFIESPSF